MSKIQWCDKVWNPITGCTPISEGCENCYAKRMSNRLKGRYGYPEDDPFEPTFHSDKLHRPLEWYKPRRIFVSSMGDLFHKNINQYILEEIFETMIHPECKSHIFIILTKRPQRMHKFISWKFENKQLPKNIWLGVTVENQKRAEERIPVLLEIPADVHFVSVEPMLTEVVLTKIKKPKQQAVKANVLDSHGYCRGLDWVIAGSESGPGRRATDIEWVRLLKNQCKAHQVPFFLKQLHEDGKKIPMPELDGKVWDQFPEVANEK